MSTSHLGQVMELSLTDSKIVVARGKSVRLFSSIVMDGWQLLVTTEVTMPGGGEGLRFTFKLEPEKVYEDRESLLGRCE